MDPIVERAEAFRQSLGMNKSRFAAKVGLLPQTYNNFTGAQGSKPNVSLIVGCIKLGADPRWLPLGEDPAIPHGPASRLPSERQ